jgi:hypothetical protein
MSERGASPIELAAGVLLLMVPVALAVMSFGPWLERVSFARLAAAQASRAVVMADGDGSEALVQLAAMTDNHGYDPGDVWVGLCGATPRPLTDDGASACPTPLPRGGSVTARVEVNVPLIVLPWRDDTGQTVAVGGNTVVAGHESFVDLYRSVGP